MTDDTVEVVFGGALTVMGSVRVRWVVFAALGASVAGCSEYRAVRAEAGASDPRYCLYCHGGASETPFRDTRGRSDTVYRGVGAHEAHVSTAALSAAIGCETCHSVPETAEDPGHMDSSLPAEVVFAGLATAGGAAPQLEISAGSASSEESEGEGSDSHEVPATLRCTNVYCHGATLSGGRAKSPTWNAAPEVLADFSSCDACHGFPPPLPHPTSHDCSACHGDVVAADGSLRDRTRHVNGVVDVVPNITCDSCHGSKASPAPPPDLSGRTSPSDRGVGAHQAHLAAQHGLSSPVACDECHRVPAKVTDPGHLDESPGAEVVLGGRAALGGLAPAFDPVSGQCTNVYCHGAALSGGSLTQPTWNDASGAARACGACHGVPPPPPHTQSQDCGSCHTETADGMAIKDPSRHVDGQVEVGGAACNACHGNAENPAPPVDTHGQSDTGLVTVGAHQSHLKAPSGLRGPLACEDCHLKPASVSDPGHLDGDGIAEVTFGALARTGGLDPVWDRSQARCASVYCHGAALQGGSVPQPLWTKVDGSQNACGACHGIPPAVGRHPSVFEEHAFMGKNCTYCHEGVTNTTGTQIVGLDRHINGVVDVAPAGGTWNPATKTCDPACHGPETW